MSDTDGLILSGCVLILACAVIVLAARVTALADDLDLMTVMAGQPGTLLDAKRMIERRRAQREEGTSYEH